MTFSSQKRWRLRFSLRGLLFTTLLLAVALAWCAWQLRIANREFNAAQQLRLAGADVSLVRERNARAGVVQSIFGEHFLNGVDRVSFFHVQKLNDNDLRPLEELRGLRELSIVHGDVTDNGLDYVMGSRNLLRLSLSGLPISKSGIVKLHLLEMLSDLDLSDTNIADDSLETIAEFSQLRVLSLRGTRVTSKGLVAIQNLQLLEVLDLANTAVDDSSLETFRNMPNLQRLIVTDTQVSGIGIKRLELALPHCHVSGSIKSTQPN